MCSFVWCDDTDFALQMKPPSSSDVSAATLNALNCVLGDYGFDHESSAFISTSLLRQQSAFTLKLAQQREAFEACIESFKCSAAAQMELQLLQLSVSFIPSWAPAPICSCWPACSFFSLLVPEITRSRVGPGRKIAQRQQKNRSRA